VRNLAKAREQLASVTKDTPAMLVAGLMERELSFRNSAQLHELYFGNLGGSGGPDAATSTRLGTAFGSLARFEELFRLACSGLYGGSGWVILDFDLRAGEPRLYWAGNHTQTVAMGVPLLVCDLYEHSYAMDYGAAAGKYVDAFWRNVDWSAVAGRLKRADAAAAALKS
jgi:Fe-Mn family superoxide dismutase